MWDNRARDDNARGPPRRHRRAADGAGRGTRKAHRGSGQGGQGRGGTGGGQGQGLRRSSRDRPSAIADRKADAPALWPALGTHGTAARSDGAGARGAREFGHRGRDRRRAGGVQDHQCRCLYPQASCAPALLRTSPARAGDRAETDRLPLLRQPAAAQVGRGYHRDAGGHRRPFGGQDPPAAMFYYSRDRADEHAQAHLADYAGSSRPTPSADTTGCTRPTASRARSSRRRAGSMPGDPSSRWPISRPPPGAGRKAKHWR